MAIQLKHRLPTGETRPWTLKEIIQGRPVDRPTHPMLVHFPIAFYIGALVVDVISRIWTFPTAPLMATWLLIGAFIGTVGAATTGLADLITMRPGSKVRKKANAHLLVQMSAAAVFVADFAWRWGSRHQARASWGWIVLEVIGVLTVTVGADIGGQLVFKMGYRVGPSAE
jgi:uncharacterized membrane protein